jgi:capsular polysaccharide biosynthesis protein
VSIDVMRALWRNAIPAMFVFIGTVVIAVVATAFQTPIYESAAQLIVAPAPDTGDTSDVIRSLETLERRTVVATFARMANQRGGAFDTRASVVPNTNIIRIDTRGPDPKRAAAIANAAAAKLAFDAHALYRVYVLRMLQPATPAQRPVYPDRQRNYIVGFAVACALALATALALERLR